MLAHIKKVVLKELKKQVHVLDKTKARGNHHYPRLLYFFKYEYGALDDLARINTLIEGMRYWNPDNLKRVDTSLLKEYMKTLRRQQSFVQTTLYIKEDIEEK